MKVAALIVGLIGALMTAGLGSKWVSDYNDNKRVIESLSGGDGALLQEVNRTKNAGYLMIVFGIAAIAAAGLVFKKAKISGAVMVAAAVIPAFLAPKALVFTFFLLIAGVLALAAKPKVKLPGFRGHAYAAASDS
jgi:hypothetical protein